jgi:hypothetical protein
MRQLQAGGCESLRAIAAGLEERGIPAARGGKWSAVQVARLLEAASAGLLSWSVLEGRGCGSSPTGTEQMHAIGLSNDQMNQRADEA